MSNSAANILSIQGLSVSYGDALALRDASLDLGVGEVLGIVGESGSGKSTLLRAVAGLLAPAARVRGSIRLEGKELVGARASELRALRGSAVSYLFQNADLSFDPLFTIGEQFDEVMRAHDAGRKGRGLSRSHSEGERRKRLARQIRALERMGFDDPERVLASLPSELSGGMAQRVALAFALAGSPRLLLADEPTSALDTASQGRVLELLRELNEQEGLALLVVSHDIELVASLADRIVVMHEGSIVEEGTSGQVMNDPQASYTRELIAAIPPAAGDIEVKPLGARASVPEAIRRSEREEAFDHEREGGGAHAS